MEHGVAPAGESALTGVKRATLLKNVPFRPAIQSRAPSLQAAETRPGKAQSAHTVSAKPRGRPLVTLQINSKRLFYFVDTGSEVTLVKERSVSLLPNLCVRDSSRTIQGV